jgi:hypothetical protein
MTTVLWSKGGATICFHDKGGQFADKSGIDVTSNCSFWSANLPRQTRPDDFKEILADPTDCTIQTLRKYLERQSHEIFGDWVLAGRRAMGGDKQARHWCASIVSRFGHFFPIVKVRRARFFRMKSIWPEACESNGWLGGWAIYAIDQFLNQQIVRSSGRQIGESVNRWIPSFLISRESKIIQRASQRPAPSKRRTPVENVVS